jgi:HAD superfamily hydrolase (TIGR01490 family)
MDRIFSKMTATQDKYAAFFDLDRTLIAEISGRAIVRTAWRKDLINWRDLSRALYLYALFLLRLKDPMHIVDNMVSWTGGKPESEIKEICDAALIELLLPAIHGEAREEIKRHREKGAKVFILSSALNYVCETMVASLDMDGHFSSALQVRNGYFTGLPEGRICFGNEKLNRMTGYCTSGNIDLADVWFYSDSISDLPVLSAVGHPVCVNPDRKLRSVAGRKSWKILLWDS